MGKQNKNIFDCQGGDFSLKSLDDSFDAEDGEWYPDNSDETDLVLAASLCKNNAAKKEKKKKKGKKKEKSTQENNPLKKLFKYDEKKEDDLESEDEEVERTERSQSKYHPMYEMAHALEEFCDLKVVDGEVYYYENTYYMHLTKDQIIELYKLRVDPKLHGAVNLRNYRDLYDYIKMEQILKYEMPKNEKLYCPFENGILFVKKGRFEDHDPEFVTFTCLNAKYNEDVESPEEADCPVFDKFMKEISGGRKDIEERLWMALGYLLVEPARGKFFFIMGYARDSGKSIWGNFVQKLFPEEAISNLSLRELGGKFETESLLDARINISLDLPRERLDVSAVSKLKRITGGDGVEIQRKNQRSKKLHRRIKFLFASNFPLEIEGEDEAFFKRVVYLPFTHSIPDDEQDPNLEKKIWKERNEIVTKATFYARRLEELDWHFPEIPDVDSMKGVQRKPPIDYLWEFINLHCEKVNHETFCPTTDLKNAYENYCEEKGVCPCSPIVINKCVIKFGGEHDRKRLNSSENAVWGFYGIKLRP